MNRNTFAVFVAACLAVSPENFAQQPIEAVPPPSSVRFGVRLAAQQSRLEELPPVAPDDEPGGKLPVPLPPLSEDEVERLPKTDEETGRPIFFPGTTTPRLTLDDLLAIALSSNPTLSQAQARVEAARGAWQQAGRPRNPRIGFQGTEMGNEGRSGLQGGFVAQEFMTGGKRALAQAVAGGQIAQAQQEYEAQRLRVISDVRGLYYLALVADQQVEAYTEFSRLQGIAHKQQLKSLEAGQDSAPDSLIFAYGNQNPLHVTFMNAQERQRNLRRQLAAVIGAPQQEINELAGDPTKGWPLYDWQESLGRLLGQSPQLAAASAAASKAGAALALQRRMVVPNVDLEVGLQHDNATADDVANVQLGLPIPLFDRNQGAIRQAQANLVAAQANVARVELSLHRRLAEVFDRYERARKQVEKFGPRVQQLRRAFALRQTAVEAGEYSALENFIAQRIYFEIWAAYLDALSELWSSVVAIDGLLLTGSLESVGSDSEAADGLPAGGNRR